MNEKEQQLEEYPKLKCKKNGTEMCHNIKIWAMTNGIKDMLWEG